ncbi:MAG: hypothetical protein IKT41_00650 [Clostridia bacterium]|nr:hypothetical protein [Clostridia bacterium]
MKMDKQQRILIPEFVRDVVGVKREEKYYLIFKSPEKFIISNRRRSGMVSSLVLDDKGRIRLPRCVAEVIGTKNIIVYVEEDERGENQIGISIL